MSNVRTVFQFLADEIKRKRRQLIASAFVWIFALLGFIFSIVFIFSVGVAVAWRMN